jgi:hypothetical protein
MLDPTSKFQPTVEYRPIRLSDLQVLEQIHVDLFPVRYNDWMNVTAILGYA